MRQNIGVLALLGAFLASLGFISNWWTGRFETYYAPTISLLTRAYGVAAIVLFVVAGWALAWPRRRQ